MNMKKLNKAQFEYLEKLITDFIETQNDINDYAFGNKTSRAAAGNQQTENWHKFFKIVDDKVLKEYCDNRICK